MFLKKAGQLLKTQSQTSSSSSFCQRLNLRNNNRIIQQKNITLNKQTNQYGFANISKDKVQEVMELYSTLRSKPIEYIYSQSLKVVEESKDNIKNYLVLNLITRAALEAKQFDKAIELSQLQIEYLKKEESKSQQIATCLYDLSLLYLQKQKMTLAFQYGFEAEEMADELYQENPKEYEHLYLQANNNVANMFLRSQNYDKSLDYSNVVVRMDVQDITQNLLQKFTALNLQTQAYQSLANDQAAHLSAEKAYILAKKNNLSSHRAYLFANLGYVFAELKQFVRAKEVLNESIEIYEQIQGKESKNIQNLKQKIREIEETEKIENMNKQTISPLNEQSNSTSKKENNTQQSQTQKKSSVKNNNNNTAINDNQLEDVATKYFKEEKYKEAEEEFKKLLLNTENIQPQDLNQYKGAILNRIFTCQYLQKKYEDSLVTALESLQCVIDDENVSRKAKACQNVGIAYEKTGDVEKSIEYYKKAQSLFDSTSTTTNLDKYQVLVNLMRLHKLTKQFDQAVEYGEIILNNILLNANLADIEIGRFKSGLSEAYYMNNQIEECFKMGEKALNIIQKEENGSKSHLFCCYQLLKAYEDSEYVEKIEKTGQTVLKLHEEIFGKDYFDGIKYQALKSLTNFYAGFGKYNECNIYLDQLINNTKNNNDYFEDYISFLILKAQIHQSLGEYFIGLELCKNIIEILKEQNKNGRISLNEETAKLYTIRYQLYYQNMNIDEFANSLIEYIQILKRESEENQQYLTDYIVQSNAVLNSFVQSHQNDYPEICEKLRKYL